MEVMLQVPEAVPLCALLVNRHIHPTGLIKGIEVLNVSHAADLALEEGRGKNMNDSAHKTNPPLKPKEDKPIKVPGESALLFLDCMQALNAPSKVRSKHAYQLCMK